MAHDNGKRTMKTSKTLLGVSGVIAVVLTAALSAAHTTSPVGAANDRANT